MCLPLAFLLLERHSVYTVARTVAEDEDVDVKVCGCVCGRSCDALTANAKPCENDAESDGGSRKNAEELVQVLVTQCRV